MNNLTDAEIIVELNKLIDMGHRAVEQCLVQLEHMEQYTVKTVLELAESQPKDTV